MPASVTWGVLLIALIALDLGGVFYVIRLVTLHPAPPFGRSSLKRLARRLLRPQTRRERMKVALNPALRRARVLRLIVYASVFGLVALPIDVGWGPLGSESDSDDYLGTLWQVVAAALALSIAMVAFAFETFNSSRERAYGGNLREFGFQTGLVVVVEIGVVALLVDGFVLFGVVGDAPAGWPALCAIAVSAASLLGVLYVFHRVLVVMDDRELLQMRRRRLQVLVDDAMRRQLLSQAGDAVMRGSQFPIGFSPLTTPGANPINAREGGQVKASCSAR
jgi:hypothetical protein